MRKIIISLTLFIFFLFITLIAILSTNGIKTKRFNNVITNKVAQSKNIELELETIKFKLDIKELSLFLETQRPKISYSDFSLPVQSVKLYIDFISILQSNPKIKKITLNLEELDIKQLNKLSILIKPSNFKSILNNNIEEGKLVSQIDIFLNAKGIFENFIAKGSVEGLKVKIFNNFSLKETNLNFFADKNDIIVKNIFGYAEDIKLSDGDIKLNLENGINLNSNFNSKISLNKKTLKKYAKQLKNFNILDRLETIDADLINNFSIELDNTYKVKNYKYKSRGSIKKSKISLHDTYENSFINENIQDIYLSDLSIQTIFTQDNFTFSGDGKYSFDNSNFQKINFENLSKKDFLNIKLNFDYANSFKIELINFKKNKNSLANFSLDFIKKKDNFKIKKLEFTEDENSIKINNLEFNNNNFVSFKKIKVETKNNNFFISNGKKILITGSKFDATNLSKIFNDKGNKNKFKKINSKIEIDFKNIKVPMSEKLEDFKLIGEIKNGKFTKIISKGDFGGENYLEISMKKDKNTDKKYLEIYSDLTRPLLTEYSFFNGLSGGKLLFTSIIDGEKSFSNLKIEKFKVINAPGIVQLLSLADLGGLADLAAGEGLSFDILEIDMEKNLNSLKLNEILALGPSMSVLMEGYQDENGITSLRGTLVPAKTINKMISKIPVIGNIIIPKEVGEGLFGISFKMKGPKGKIKTTINPIRTITPRFIQKILDREKKTK